MRCIACGVEFIEKCFPRTEIVQTMCDSCQREWEEYVLAEFDKPDYTGINNARDYDGSF